MKQSCHSLGKTNNKYPKTDDYLCFKAKEKRFT